MADKPPLFTVTDRRKFTTEGELREGRPQEPVAPVVAETKAENATPENFATPETASTTGGPGLHLVGTEGRVDDSQDSSQEEQEDLAIQSRNPGAAALTGPDQGLTGQDNGVSDGGLYDAAPSNAETAYLDEADQPDDGLGPMPTAPEIARQDEAYTRSSALIDRMVQQANPAAPPPVKMDFEQLVQSIYLSAIVAMGAGGEPGEQPRIDILGARQSIDMLTVVSEKTAGNLGQQEQRLLQSAVFNLRQMFLEITSAIAAQAQAQRGPQGGAPPARGPRGIGSVGPRRPGSGK